VHKFLLGAGYLQDVVDSYKIATDGDHGEFYTMMGVHPCRAKEPFIDFKSDQDKGLVGQEEIPKEEIVARYLKKMDDFYAQATKKDKFVAIGECGLDYDRFEYADKETQLM
jgi:TatD DNase family protein